MRVTKVFLKSVKVELDTIKSKATAIEIGRLDFSQFNHRSEDRCIYGQMTGVCSSSRAEELYPKQYQYIGEIDVSEYCNRPSLGFYIKGSDFTPLEKYLYLVSSDKHLEIIQYLKGEIDSIVIEIDIP